MQFIPYSSLKGSVAEKQCLLSRAAEKCKKLAESGGQPAHLIGREVI